MVRISAELRPELCRYRREGVGKLNNVPVLVGLDFGDVVKFKTNEEGITYGHK